MPSERHARRIELAHERGFDTPYQSDQWIRHERAVFGDIDFDTALELAQFERDYEQGDMTRDELEAWWEDHFGPVDWDDPEDPFFDFLDALSGEGE